jgi:hypothetical protein
MTVGPVLPAGNDAFDGVESVRGHMFSCQKLDGRLMSIVAARDICNRCNPSENPSSYKNCQHAALGGLGALGHLAEHGATDSARVAAFDAIGMVLFGVAEEIAEPVFQNHEVLDAVICAIDRSLNVDVVVSQPERQSALYCLLQLSQLECLHGVLAPLLSRVRDLLLDPLSLHAVKADSLSVLSSFAARPSSPIATTMDEDTLEEATVQLAAGNPEHCLALGLLLADLKDYGLLDGGDRFADALHRLRHEHDFMGHFKAALAASVIGHQWPEDSNCFPSIERMTWCAAHLTELGAVKELQDSAPLIIEASLLCQAAEKPAFMALRHLAEIPVVFQAIESRKEFMQMLEAQEIEEANELQEYVKRMRRTMIVWCCELSPMSQAAKLMAAQSHHSKAVQWREAVSLIPEESSLDTLRRLENWHFGTYGHMQLVGRVAWLWSEESQETRLGMCFSAFKRLLIEKKQQRKHAFSEELQMLNGEALTLRQGSVVRRGPEALMHLALKWNRKDLSGITEGCGSPAEMQLAEEVLGYMELFEELHNILLHGLILPQIYPPAEVEESDVYMEVHKARCEAEAMLLQLENDLALKKKMKRLCGDRLTIADLYAVSVLRVGDIIGQEWFRYPSISQYLDSMALIPGYAEAFESLKIVIDDTQQRIRSSGNSMILV